jgi:hypothetical protein
LELFGGYGGFGLRMVVRVEFVKKVDDECYYDATVLCW